jgi:hypothetical protein
MPRPSAAFFLICLSSTCAAVSPAVAQEASSQSAGAQTARDEANARSNNEPESVVTPCEQPKKKKKGFGLGSLLKAARNSGLANLAGTGTMGREGALASAAVGTAAHVSEAAEVNRTIREPDGC